MVIEGQMHACDISGVTVLRIAGADAPAFVRTMFTGPLEPLDELFGVSVGLFLTSEGEVIDIAHVVRTGGDEYLLMCSQNNGPELVEWLAAHSEISDDAGPVFADLSVEDQSAALGVLVMYGAGIDAIHADLADACQGKTLFISVRYEQPCWGILEAPAYVLFAPLPVAAQVGEFLSPYLSLEVIDKVQYLHLLVTAKRYCAAVTDADYHTPAELGVESYMRLSGDFVGARAAGVTKLQEG